MTEKKQLGRKPKYPWQSWFDFLIGPASKKTLAIRGGRTTQTGFKHWPMVRRADGIAHSIVLRRGDHFDCEPYSMMQQVRKQAKQLRLSVTVIIREDTVIVLKN